MHKFINMALVVLIILKWFSLAPPATLLKKRLWQRCFPVNFGKFLRTPFLQNTSGRLLLFLAFQKLPPEVFYEKMCSWKFPKIHRKTPLVCKIFKNTFFTDQLRTTASDFY